MTVTVTNASTTDIDVTAIALGETVFSVEAPPPLPVSLAQGEDLELSVDFLPDMATDSFGVPLSGQGIVTRAGRGRPRNGEGQR